MNSLSNLAVGFDYTKIPKDFLETVPSPNQVNSNQTRGDK